MFLLYIVRKGEAARGKWLYILEMHNGVLLTVRLCLTLREAAATAKWMLSRLTNKQEPTAARARKIEIY